MQKAITGKVRKKKAVSPRTCTVVVCSPDYSTVHFEAGFLWVSAAVHFVVMNGAILIEVAEAL